MPELRRARRSPSADGGPGIAGDRPVVGRVVVDIRDPERLDRVTEALVEVDLVVVSDHAEPFDAELVGDNRPDLVVSDDVRDDGSMGDRLRAWLSLATAPVIAITVSETAGIASFEQGAADFVIDPFMKRELQARALARLRRPSTGDGAELRLDRAARSVSVRGADVTLSPREYDLLEFFVERPRTVVTREHILAVVWRAKPEWQDPNTVTEHVYRLRRKIERDPSRPELLVTVRGVGYRFDQKQQP